MLSPAEALVGAAEPEEGAGVGDTERGRQEVGDTELAEGAGVGDTEPAEGAGVEGESGPPVIRRRVGRHRCSRGAVS